MAREVFAVNHTLTGGRSFGDQDIITYRVQYPEFVSYTPLASLERINAYYKDAAQTLAWRFMDDYSEDALADYQEHSAQGLTFQPYALIRPYTVTYGQNCVISLYLDASMYTGGAHGITLRTSDTWEALTGMRIPLSGLFPPGFDYAELLMGLIVEEASLRNQAEPGLYFDDLFQRVPQSFDENSFYLTPEALVLYFQAYDIAPFSTGIPVFAFDYELVGATVPDTNCS